MFEYTVSLGNVLQSMAYLGVAIGFFFAMRSDINVLRSEMGNLKLTQQSMTEAMAQLGQVLTSVAVQDTRINMIEKKIDELAHGRGYVRD